MSSEIVLIYNHILIYHVKIKDFLTMIYILHGL